MSRHVNLGTWKGVRAVPPKLQIVWWFPAWKGVRWHRWSGGVASILRGSLLLGYVELRFWRRPTLNTRVEYPDLKSGSQG